MSWWVAGATAVTSIGTGLASQRAASQAAGQNTQASLAQIQLQREQRDDQIALLEPFRELGTSVGLEGLQRLSTEQGQQDYLGDYYGTTQYQAQAAQIRNQQLASAEAAGGLGSTTTQNQLARIAPNLGNQALQNQRNLYGQLANIGLQTSGSQASYAGRAAQNSYAALQSIGNANAEAAQAGFQGAVQGAGLGLQIGGAIRGF